MASSLSKLLVAIIIIGLIVLLSVGAFFWGYRYVRQQDERMRALNEGAAAGGVLADEHTPGAVAVFIPRSADMEQIANILKDKGLVNNTLSFRLFSKFNGFDGHYQAGTHYLLPGMNFDEMMFTLTKQPEPLKITFTEGETYQEMKAKMIEAGLNIDEKRMDDLIRHPNDFLDYQFVRSLSSRPDREWLLQGYLWPDTYWFDPNQDELSIIRMLLDNTENKLEESNYLERAKAMNMSLDEVMTIASIVQKEGNIQEMSKIGRVFLNRMQAGMPLESCATINYLRAELGEKPIPWATHKDLQRFAANPYNTYTFPGLPPGPINNPGTLAIEGILWPATEQSWAGANSYLYFCATGEGDNKFATTLEEHEANVAYYSKQWEEGGSSASETESEEAESEIQ